jgi:hypothetical protein
VKNVLILLVLCSSTVVGQTESFTDTNIRLNDIRVIASHNSYKKRPDPKVLKFLARFKRKLGEEMDPGRMDYGHLSFSEQFDHYNVRGLELDLYYDPRGGKYRKRRLNFFISGLKQRSGDSVMRQPGFKMLHIADVDYETHYLTFIEGLTEVKKWSDSHPDHSPIFINIEPKNDSPGDHSKTLRLLGFKRALKFDSLAFDLLDKEIFSIFQDSSQVFKPKDLKSNYGSVSDRLSNEGWPTLKECLGKVIFIIDGDRGNQYQLSLETGADRPMFVYSEPGSSSTAFVKRNDPIGKESEIQELTERYIVRTRTDVETMQARNNDYTLFESAMMSQAQLLSTDFYKADERFSTFKVTFDDEQKSADGSFILRKKRKKK